MFILRNNSDAISVSLLIPLIFINDIVIGKI